MARYGAHPALQAQKVTADIIRGLRDTVPILCKSERAYSIRFTVKIRHGVAETVNYITSDEFVRQIHHANTDDPEMQIRRIEQMLLRDLPKHLGLPTIHGAVMLTVTVKNKTVGFGVEVEKQIRYTWREDGSSAT